MPDIDTLPRSEQLGSLELTEEIIQRRAYELFEKRGYQHGHDVDDWLQAEAEVMGNKFTAIVEEIAEPQDANTGLAA